MSATVGADMVHILEAVNAQGDQAAAGGGEERYDLGEGSGDNKAWRVRDKHS